MDLQPIVAYEALRGDPMSDEIVFYHDPMSRGRIARWMLEEVGVDYRTVVLDLRKREHKTADYLAINPMGKVPTIVHGDTVVTEAAAICAYLADTFPERDLAPPLQDRTRGTYYRWIFFGAGCLEPALVDRMLTRPPVERPGSLGWGSYEDTIATLEKAVEQGRFLCGERFTAADVYVGSQVAWGVMVGALEETPILASYLARLRDRPAAERANAKDAELIAARSEG